MRIYATLRRRPSVYILVAFVFAGLLLASAARAQSTQPMGHGDAHGMMRGHMMAGQMMAGHMMGHHMVGGAMGMHGMMAHGMLAHGGSTATASGSSTANAAQAQAEASNAVQEEAQTAPPGFPAALQSADAQRGQQLAATSGCTGCHSLNPRARMVGPTWYDLAETAKTRVPGQSVEAYLYTSIVHPNAYVVPGYAPNIMVQTYGRTLGEGEIADLVSYLLTLHE